MREIKFRGKRIDNSEWVYGNIQVPKPPFDRWFMWDEEHRQCEVIPETVGQFTGLLDKNGKEIYEGDIIEQRQFGEYIEIVSFSEGCFVVNSDQTLTSNLCDFKQHNIEVIGNIHENE